MMLYIQTKFHENISKCSRVNYEMDTTVTCRCKYEQLLWEKQYVFPRTRVENGGGGLGGGKGEKRTKGGHCRLICMFIIYVYLSEYLRSLFTKC